MNKLELDNMKIMDQVKYMNNEIRTSTISNVVKTIGIGRTTISDRFKKIGYIYNKELKQYAESNATVIQLHQSNTTVAHEPPNNVVAPIVKGNTKVTQKYENDLLELIDNKVELLEMLKYYKNNANIIDVPQLDINTLPGELQKDIINKSIKIYKPVQKLYDEVCSQYPSYKKQDLISLALYEFYNKYKK